MKKSKLTRTLMAAVSVVALSAVMYGCVHSGDDAPPPVDQPDPPDPVDVDTKKINDAIDAATTAINALTAMSSDADVTAAQGLIDAAQAALDATTVLSVTDVRALQNTINAAQTSLGAKQTAINNYRTHQSQLAAANTAVDAATTAVNGLTAMSSDADVMAADTAVAAAKAAVAAGTMLTEAEKTTLNSSITLAEANLVNKKSQIADQRDQDEQNRQHATVSGAITSAAAAIDGLTAMASDADVAAAQSAIDSAQEALDATTVLPSSDVFALQARINAAMASLTTKRSEIADYRTHRMQYRAAMNAVDAAEMAVAGLSVDSTDAEVAAADTAIAAAKQSVMDGTMLTDAEKASLNGDISTAEASLSGVKRQIADRNTHQMQHTTAMNAVSAAETAVGALDETSSDADVTAAESAVAMAEAAVADGTMLTALERATLNGRIALTKVNLANAKTDITDQRRHDQQLTATTNAVGAAEMAVSGLTAMSTDADVQAARDAIATARATLALATELSAAVVLDFQAKISAAQTSLGTKQTEIANYRTHGTQHATATRDVELAENAVDGLNAMSSDEEVAAAEAAIATAKASVAAGTMLTADEMAALNGKITMAETSLGTAKMAINNYRTHVSQLDAANKAAEAATMAVDGLNAMSSDADVAAAQAKIDAADQAVTDGTMLTDAEKAALNGRIAIAKVNLGNTRIAINDYRTEQGQRTAAMNAVSAAETAVAALDADSTDEEVADAEQKIADAKQAVTDGTMLTDDEKEELNGKIETAEEDLSDTKEQIALRKRSDAAVEVARLHGEASGATTDAANAAEAAEKAVEDAKKYSGMLGVLDVGGDSTKAQQNAQKVLDAKDAATMAARDATAAKTRAQTAKTAATALSEDTTGRQAVIDALDAAIKAADGHIKTATDIRDAKATVAESLASYVQVVTGTDEDDPDTPADKGKEVADLINAALIAGVAQVPVVNADLSASALPTTEVAHTETAAGTGKVVMGPSDAQGRTWAQIGGSDLVDKRIVAGSGTATTRAVKAKSVAGMTMGDLFASGSLPARTAVGTNDGTEVDTDVAYKGIAGVLFCAGSDCKVGGDTDETTHAAGDELTGSWYFAPDAGSMATYVAGATAGTYSLEEVDTYVRYGYWLTREAGAAGLVSINRYADGPNAQTTPALYGVTAGDSKLGGTSATYTGNALGMSVVKTFDSDGAETSRASGGFTADVELTMKFGTTPKLGGTIDNFQGSAVDSSWEVELSEADIDVSAGGVAATDGVTNRNDAGTNQGTWSATIWGGREDDGGTTGVNEAARPEGVYGGFDAVFTNGNVAGVYATRKQ